MKKITILGRIPSKKNSRVMVCMGKIPRSLPSANYTKWHKDASAQLQGIKKIKDGQHIHITFFFPDKRKTDLTNKAESIMDLLVDNEILKDDNWNCVPTLTLTSGGVDKENPRAEIVIKK